MTGFVRRCIVATALAATISLLSPLGQQAQAQSPTPTPSYSPSPTPTPAPSSSPSPTPSPSPAPSPSPSPTPPASLPPSVSPPTSPNPGVTGAGSSAGSIGDLANQRFNQMITHRVLGTVLLGVNEQINCSDCISTFGSAGS